MKRDGERKKRLNFFLLAILLVTQIIFFISPPPLHSTVVRYKDLETLTEEADLIIKGTVKEIRSEWNPERTLIISYITIAINEQYKGDPKAEITIKQIGGELDGRFTKVIGAPEFTLGEEVVLFLELAENDFYHVNGMFQGKYRIENRKAKHRDDRRNLPLEDLERKIKEKKNR